MNRKALVLFQPLRLPLINLGDLLSLYSRSAAPLRNAKLRLCLKLQKLIAKNPSNQPSCLQLQILIDCIHG